MTNAVIGDKAIRLPAGSGDVTRSEREFGNTMIRHTENVGPQWSNDGQTWNDFGSGGGGAAVSGYKTLHDDGSISASDAWHRTGRNISLLLAEKEYRITVTGATGPTAARPASWSGTRATLLGLLKVRAHTTAIDTTGNNADWVIPNSGTSHDMRMAVTTAGELLLFNNSNAISSFKIEVKNSVTRLSDLLPDNKAIQVPTARPAEPWVAGQTFFDFANKKLNVFGTDNKWYESAAWSVNSGLVASPLTLTTLDRTSEPLASISITGVPIFGRGGAGNAQNRILGRDKGFEVAITQGAFGQPFNKTMTVGTVTVDGIRITTQGRNTRRIIVWATNTHSASVDIDITLTNGNDTYVIQSMEIASLASYPASAPARNDGNASVGNITILDAGADDYDKVLQIFGGSSATFSGGTNSDTGAMLGTQQTVDVTLTATA